ncbi:kinesin-like protein KIN-7F [Benincasa hispida]|uniref:kinesin-like protein KIN-7F n=1 Tax=Benincasa hispida TaxID=102211 RepID=UPI0018FF6863|nr:kinesin-like protein KIN-7F [Benincasa hispida]XP_038895756.1 kinesin-like protein KIN-7F [Benincasa hispida]XP_038895762.1 kinesin-like protein KIN-7F [Benincasa hispida]XP_038895769.1 kinesin-like protein KIN-7F [Benincasa hispida]XP_038895772.1 kinesin-like protein KIN-7F [Benincasa hispida]
MGAVGGEELIMEETSGREERILVSVRLRPLNEKEISRNDVSEWECINDNTVICRNALSVAERSLYPSAYTFDRVFGCDCSTRKVYEEGAKEVALSVVSGVNSTIFAYGQTSSGKTYTMSGITEYTVADIYDYIEKHTDREFLLKFSAIEIYNESVRDLLSIDNSPLRLLDDPERGTTVEKLTEETLRDWNHFRQLLSLCEAQRQIGETSLNEASSRSHQILRLTIESSAREFLGKDKSSSLTATVNFVDLAGSERASQSLSAGARLKEGCHINRSLLTLGTVIRKLSKGRNGHIPFRDSKLTRILQSSLGGNARTAVICTMSPAQIHAEQSRNTLFFASCAKEVVTNAQVNVVVSDKALVKQLQRELARLESELKSSVQTSGTPDYTLIREKDLQIEKLKKDLRELTLERDYAQSQVKDLLRMVEEDKPSISSTDLDDQYPRLRVQSSWDFENRPSETTVMTDSRIIRDVSGSFDASQYSGGHSIRSDDNFTHLVEVEKDFLKGKSPPRVSSMVPSLVDTRQHMEVVEELSCENSEDICKEVRCIEMEESSMNRYLVSTMSGSSPERYINSTTPSPIANTATSKVVDNGQSEKCKLESSPAEEDSKSNNFSPFYVILSPEKPSPWNMEKDICNSGRLNLTRSRSCKASIMRTLSTENIKEFQGTPPIWLGKDFVGRPEGFQIKLAALKYDVESERSSLTCSQTSQKSASKDAHGNQNFDVLEDDKSDVTTSELEHDQISNLERENRFPDAAKQISNIEGEKHLLDATVLEAKPRPIESEKNVEDVGMDPIHNDNMISSSKWPSEFSSLQKDIIELWHICNVSLVHRTYFFLLFKGGDPADSIYMEVEFRRLSFLKDTFSQGNPTIENGQTPTSASSMKALRRERQMLCRQMQKRLSKKQRETLFVEWGIGLNSNNRRLQLAHLVWNDTKDMDHIRKSAAIVAKLVNYVEPDQASREMFGLNFTPRHDARGITSFETKHEGCLVM